MPKLSQKCAKSSNVFLGFFAVVRFCRSCVSKIREKNKLKEGKEMNRKTRTGEKTVGGFSPYGCQEARRCWNKIDKNHSNTKSALNPVGFARGYGFGAVVVFLRGKTNERCFYVEKLK